MLPSHYPIGLAMVVEGGGGRSWLKSGGGADSPSLGDQDTEFQFESLFVGMGIPFSFHPFPWAGAYVHPRWLAVFNGTHPEEGSHGEIHLRGLRRLHLFGGSVGLKLALEKYGLSRSIVVEGTAMRDRQLGWVPSVGIHFESAWTHRDADSK